MASGIVCSAMMNSDVEFEMMTFQLFKLISSRDRNCLALQLSLVGLPLQICSVHKSERLISRLRGSNILLQLRIRMIEKYVEYVNAP